jgi:polyisoprenoid-binding protein YceI
MISVIKFVILLVAVTFVPLSALANNYVVDKDKSQLTFSGVHAGNDFDGVFEEWSADIIFDAQDLENSAINATIMPKSAATGNKMYDGTLPQKDWFDVKNHSEITFSSSEIKATEAGLYQAIGTINVKEISKPFTMDFALDSQENGAMKATSEFEINRLDFDIGKKSDPKAEWVSEIIRMKLDVIAAPQGE